MPYYLKHLFDPDFDRRLLRPASDDSGRVDRYDLGYVQNVIKGQLLAELLPPENFPSCPDERFMLREPVFPAGPGVCIDPDSPLRLKADDTGHVLYRNGLITVENRLEVPTDVNFHTGNITFGGDLIVHGDIRAGFEVRAGNLRIKGMIEGGIARSDTALMVEGGVRGGRAGRCLAEADGNLGAAFAEKAELRAGGELVVERFCLYGALCARGTVMIGDRLVGGVCRAASRVVIRGDLGNRSGTLTRIVLGRDPFALLLLDRCTAQLEQVQDRLAHYERILGTTPSTQGSEAEHRKEACRRTYEQLSSRCRELKNAADADESLPIQSRLVVQGTVYPGVEVSIGNRTLRTTRALSRTCFRLREGVVMSEQASEQVME